jgi:CRISPR-associated endonuclease/helicase Cas3
LLVLNEILKKKPEVNKIFYVFPFTSLISQTFDFIKDNLHLTENELIQLHSKAPYTKSNIGNDDEYGSKRKNYIDSLFVNYPIVLLTHIKFFDILTSNEKEPNYLLHRLTNSIIILDEMQSYTPSEWDKINYFLQNYSNSLNITFILMSATLPKISKLLIDKNAVANDPFVYLITNKNKYFNNPNFQNRVKFRFDYVDKMKFNNENLADIVSKHSEEYFNKNGRVQSIIEFITKNSAQSFFEFINDNSILTDYKKFIITGTILYPRRNEIIKYLKSNVKEDSKILIIATQVIEAGLDIDMDIGFKDMSIMDSEEQFAGRINRNASKNNSEIFLFKSNLAQHVYNSDLRFREQKNIGKEILYEILQNKDFDSYYSFIFNNIEKFNQDIFAENLSSFLVLIKQLNYTEIKRKFELIKSDTISIFVPLKISKESFTENELDFINTFNQSNSNSYNEVSGRDIWTIYKNLITNKKLHFVDKKADLRILSSILTKFTFSVWKNTNFYQLLKNYGNEEYGYFFLDYWEDIYSYENGLKTDLETDCNFL